MRAPYLTRLVVAAVACSTLAISVSAAPQWPGDRRTGERPRGSVEAYNGRRYQDPARARGFSDGFKRGRDDRNDNHRFELQREKDYRKADNGYSRSYGSKDRYRDEYRDGFRQGYEDGFRGRFGR